MPPSRYLGLPWPEWGETDVLLTTSLNVYESLICQCCGQWSDIAHDPETDGWWEVVTDEVICYAGATLSRWKSDKGPDDLEPGAIPFIRLDPEYEPAKGASRGA